MTGKDAAAPGMPERQRARRWPGKARSASMAMETRPEANPNATCQDASIYCPIKMALESRAAGHNPSRTFPQVEVVDQGSARGGVRGVQR